MGYPTQIVHRRNRRRLGRGQGPFPADVTATLTPSGSTVVINFSAPVNVNGNIGLTVATRTFVSQAINSPTQVTVTMNGTVATFLATLPTADPALSSYTGGKVLGVSRTFP